MSSVNVQHLLGLLKRVNDKPEYDSFHLTDFEGFSKIDMEKHIHQGKVYASEMSDLVKDLLRTTKLLTSEEMETLKRSQCDLDIKEAADLNEFLREHLSEAESHYKLMVATEMAGQVSDEDALAVRLKGLDAFETEPAGVKSALPEVVKQLKQVDFSVSVTAEENETNVFRKQFTDRLESTCAQWEHCAGSPRISTSPGALGAAVTEKGLKNQVSVSTQSLLDTLVKAATQSSSQIDQLAGTVAQLVRLQIAQLDSQSGSSSYRNELNMGEGITPKGLVLQPFSGENPEEFEGWWQMFEVVIGNNSRLSPTAKLLYLKSYMVDEAKDVIDALPVTAECYKVACDTLKERFGFDALCYDLSYLKLKELSVPKPPNNAKALMKLYYKQFAQYKRIIAKGTFPMGYMELCLQPYPAKIQTTMRQEQIRFTQRHNSTLDSATFMKELRCTIQVYAEVEDVKETFCDHKVEPRDVHQGHGKFLSRSRGWTCRLCRNIGHKEYRCQRYRTAALRAKVVSDTGLCPKCYLPNHGPQGCSQGSCSICDGEHGVAVCPMWQESRQDSGLDRTRESC